MSTIETLRGLAREWSRPKPAYHRGNLMSLALQCSLRERETAASVQGDIPSELAEFWSLADEARLFEDRTYGQWGLVLLGRDDAKRRTAAFSTERTGDVEVGDVVVGEFLGDQELLIVRCNPSVGDFGTAMIALPLDARGSWYVAAPTFLSFLERYRVSQGAKFWEEALRP
jgi:hypothetical protein